MMVQLTAEQRDELSRHGNRPVQVVDPVTCSVYFLVAGEMYERIKCLIDTEPFDITDAYAAQSAAAGAAGWDDPEMDIYDDYDAHRPKA
jgi:hypothetical protein